MHPYRGTVPGAAHSAQRVVEIASVFDGTIMDIEHVSPASTLPLDGGRFPLLRYGGAGWELLFSQEMTGELDELRPWTTLFELRSTGRALPVLDWPDVYAVPFPPGARAHVHIGSHAFHIGWTDAPPRHDMRSRASLRGLRFVALPALAMLLLVATIASLPGSLKSENDLDPKYRVPRQRICIEFFPPLRACTEEMPEWLRPRKKGAPKASQLKRSPLRDSYRQSPQPVLAYLQTNLFGPLLIDGPLPAGLTARDISEGRSRKSPEPGFYCGQDGARRH